MTAARERLLAILEERDRYSIALLRLNGGVK